jgi:dTDP-4-amino-4,6-dideoxygalactose transaminase
LEDGFHVSRDELLSKLKEKNIDARNAQPRMSQMPMFESRFINTVAEKIEAKGVILPSAFNLSSDDINRVCDEIIRFA